MVSAPCRTSQSETSMTRIRHSTRFSPLYGHLDTVSHGNLIKSDLFTLIQCTSRKPIMERRLQCRIAFM